MEPQAADLEMETGRPVDDPVTLFLVETIKEATCFVSLDYDADVVSCSQSAALQASYAFSSGNAVTLARERFQCVEPLFNASLSGDQPTLPSMITRSIALCDPAERDELWSNIVLCGGNTLLPNFPERLQQELMVMSPPNSVGLVVAPDRRNLAWLGGAIYANLDHCRDRYGDLFCNCVELS